MKNLPATSPPNPAQRHVRGFRWSKSHLESSSQNPKSRVWAAAAKSPRDLHPEQWGLRDESGADINIEGAWAQTTGSRAEQAPVIAFLCNLLIWSTLNLR